MGEDIQTGEEIEPDKEKEKCKKGNPGAPG